MSQIFHQCIKESFVVFKHDYTRRINNKMKLSQKLKSMIHITAKFIVAFSVPFLPKFVLFPLLKVMSDINFYNLKKRYKSKANYCVVPNALAISYCLAFLNLINHKKIYLAGFDGYSKKNTRYYEANTFFNFYKIINPDKIFTITPSKFNIETVKKS